MTDPILQIAVQCYQHEAFIEECVRSLCEQRTSYPYEVIVFEDHSTDRSRDILNRLTIEYPDKLRLVYNEKNLGDYWNLRSNFTRIKSRYFALVDGDDYWLDRDKIEKSISFLETSPNFSAFCQNVRYQYEDGRPSRLNFDQAPRHVVHSAEDIASGYYHHLSGIIYRNIFTGELPKVLFDERAGDWLMSIIHAQHGPFQYDHHVGSVYRIHPRGFWNHRSELHQLMMNLDACFIYDNLLEGRFRHVFQKRWKMTLKLLIQLIRDRHSPSEVSKYFWLWCTYSRSPGFFPPIRRWASRRFREKLDQLPLRLR